jgi:hypothetical protein
MIIVIQCAASKRPDAGHLVTSDGRAIKFVAHPEIAPAEPNHLIARPDDTPENGMSWRTQLLKYNETQKRNPQRLLPAYQLYENKTYRLLVERFGSKSVYILSAGWGLIHSDFLTPHYDITFSLSADAYKRRRRTDRFQDFCMLSDEADEEIVFLGGKDYLPLFCELTRRAKGQRIAFFNSANAPQFQNCTFKRFETRTRTNWHYECAKALLDRTIRLQT